MEEFNPSRNMLEMEENERQKYMEDLCKHLLETIADDKKNILESSEKADK